MILMALDHSLSMIGKISYGNEAWGISLPNHDSLLHFLPRLLSHLCAPGFLFLMGVGVPLLIRSRLEKGWTYGQIRFYLIKRGLLLIVLQHFIYNPPWMILIKVGNFPPSPFPGDGGIPWFSYSILSTLGMLLIFWAILGKVRTRTILFISVTTLIASQVVIYYADPEVLYNPLVRLLSIPGQSGSWLVRYPLVPWVGLTGLGVLWGRSYLADKGLTYKRTLYIAMLLIGGFCIIRMANGFGNFHGRGSSLLTFFHVTKYPPSLAFLSLTMGVNLFLLWNLFNMNKPIRVLQIIGSSPLFFYLIHIYVYLLIGFLFPHGASFWVVVPFWVLGILLLVPLCKKYSKFKQNKPVGSFWRML